MTKATKRAALACAVAAALGLALYFNGSTAADEVADNQVTAAATLAADPAAVARGAYVSIQGDCAACHTVPGGRAFAGGYGLQTPFGVIYSTNITPDIKTGIGNWTERDFFRAVRHGRHKNGQLLYPAMPYNAYVKISDADMHDLWAYMRTLQPVEQSPSHNTLGFPYNIRHALWGWNLLFFDNAPFVTQPAQSAAWNRGRYLVDGPGHCAACHTPKNFLGGDTGRYLQGAELLGSYAPEITADPYRGLGSWSREQLQTYLRTGANHQAIASGAMGEAIEFSTQHLNDQDLAAIAEYLKSVPGSNSIKPQAMATTEPVMRRGAQVYEQNCMACHNVAGEGIAGMVTGFADNPGIRTPSGSNLVAAILKGSKAVTTSGNVTGAGMPSFDWKLGDADIAAVLTYVRNSWGNAASQITPEQVATARRTLDAKPQMLRHF
ncbi:c-type cytochrome [Pseudomonas vanderleydeniana]|uniref:Cytochrome c n=1 Tax=Pseudomonas vanderleydeniana TaxID=2745495 RepID=A0A9E6TV25_9PSED|nr:cytochrome c [Pseudomonas vanderleydeniana]QXI30885.1 cytochrome c [Pseudomonas vanderleydeniana]